MNEILKNTHVFVDVLCMSRCDTVRQWDEGAFQKAYKWANYFEEVTETKFNFPGPCSFYGSFKIFIVLAGALIYFIGRRKYII